MALIKRIQHAALKRAAYLETRDQLRSLPLDIALDLDIDRTAAKQIARRAVYGK